MKYSFDDNNSVNGAGHNEKRYAGSTTRYP